MDKPNGFRLWDDGPPKVSSTVEHLTNPDEGPPLCYAFPTENLSTEYPDHVLFAPLTSENYLSSLNQTLPYPPTSAYITPQVDMVVGDVLHITTAVDPIQMLDSRRSEVDRNHKLVLEACADPLAMIAEKDRHFSVTLVYQYLRDDLIQSNSRVELEVELEAYEQRRKRREAVKKQLDAKKKQREAAQKRRNDEFRAAFEQLLPRPSPDPTIGVAHNSIDRSELLQTLV